MKSRHWLWLLLVIPVALGLARLRFDVDVLNLLPDELRTVQGLKLYQQHFSNARELILTVRASSAEETENAARTIAEALRNHSNLVERVTWQPPWLEHPGQLAEILAHLWFNQPPEIFSQLARRLEPGIAAETLARAREALATSMSPDEIARLSYDPFGLTQLPEAIANSAPKFTSGNEMFASADGTFRVVFVQAKYELPTYRECANWLNAVQQAVAGVAASQPTSASLQIGCTGRPAFVAEIAGGMRRDMIESIGGTSVIIAVLFWFAHRRWKPMLWLLALLALVLVGTLGFGGLLFGRINVVSMGFAAILLGLAVDYAVVHYQEALAHPDLSVPEIRRAIAPSIFWAAFTTIAAFLVLNFGGLPGLAQLGSLVGVGVALAACVMIFAYLPPLFPERRRPRSGRVVDTTTQAFAPAPSRLRTWLVCGATLGLLALASAVLTSGLPKVDPTAEALRPRNSPAYTAMAEIGAQLAETRDPLWLLVAGQTESEAGRRLDEVEASLTAAVSNGAIAGFALPTALWPRPERQVENRPVAKQLAGQRDALHEAARASGFADTSLALTDAILETWTATASRTNVFWPSNEMSEWLLGKATARTSTNLYAFGLIYPANAGEASRVRFAALDRELSRDSVWISGWGLLGNSVFSVVKGNMWMLLAPMIVLVLLSLLFAFRRLREVLLSIATMLVSGLCLLAIMRIAGWSWNLLNLMSIPLILGTGVDYSIFTQLALRRYHGDLGLVYRSVGRALLLCGATAIAGFGSLALSSNAGMSSLGAVCAVGIACNMLISVFLLPVWWRLAVGEGTEARGEGRGSRDAHAPRAARHSTPSSLYRVEFWKLGLWFARILPRRMCGCLSRFAAWFYWMFARHRREIVIQNLLPALNGDFAAAERKAKALFARFALKLADLWRYENGLSIQDRLGQSTGWDHFTSAQSQKRGVLLLTPHLGNWEFGGAWLAQKGVTLQVVTLAEPGEGFTELRQAARARWHIETLVIGNDPFAFLEIIKRLEVGATVALLIDRPLPATAVTVKLFGQPFSASIAPAELARASGCALLPAYLPREGDIYSGHMLPPILYDRAALRDRGARVQLTQQIMDAFEPVLCQHLDQWYHFVPIWPK